MSTAQILTARDGAVATVTINRPTVLNALDAQTVRTLTSVLRDLGQDDEIRCVVLTGAGDRAFVAGADITELARLTPISARAVSDAGHRLCALLEGLGKPVIAAINGVALGGGCEIAMACTLRIAATTAKLGQPEIALGLIPGFGGTQRLPRLVGRGRALEMLLTGAPIDAEEAWRIGLVNKVVPPEALAAATSRLARGRWPPRRPVAVRRILEAVHHGLDMSLAEAAVFEASTFGLVYGTEDVRGGNHRVSREAEAEVCRALDMETLTGTGDARDFRVGIVVSTYNDFVTNRLRDGAVEALRAAGVADDAIVVATVPGGLRDSPGGAPAGGIRPGGRGHWPRVSDPRRDAAL